MVPDMPPNPADPESNDTPPTVTVRGDAIIRAEPDEALLWVTLDALKDAPGPALSDVSARSTALVALLDELGVAKPDRSTTGVTVYEDFDHTQTGRQSLGHRAISRVSVRVTDPEVIGRLIAQATEDLAARIDGPRWQIAPKNPARLEAARQAAADGRRKAQAYADGVGATLGRLIRLVEPDDYGHMRVSGAARSLLAAEPMPVEQGEHEIAASIHATFALELG
jgi:uncharacterized protein